MKVCILGAAFDTANMGVSVLAAGAIRAALHRFPGAEIIQMDYGRKPYSFHFRNGSEATPGRFVNIRFSKKLYLPNHICVLLLLALLARLVVFESLRNRVLRCNSWLKELAESDLVLSLAGGDSFSDIYGLRRLLYISLPQLLALIAGRKLLLMPQTIGPFRRGVARLIAQYILRKADVIYCRDAESARLSRDLIGPHSRPDRVRVCYDLGFEVEAVNSPDTQIAGLCDTGPSAGPLVGINISGLLMMGGYNRSNMFGLALEYGDLIRQLIDLFITNYSARVLLVPHTGGSAGESDISACEALFETLQDKYIGRLGIVRGGDYAAIKYAIGRCDFFIGARMHACIGSLSQSVPAISLAYSGKFAGVMETIDSGGLVVDLRKVTIQEAIQFILSAFSQRLTLKQTLERRMPSVKQTVRNVLADVNILRSMTRPAAGSLQVAKVGEEL